MFHDYPYTDFHEMNLDYILKLCRESLGIHLVVSGNNLQLVNDLNQVLSQVTISFAETAAKDTEGNNITAYLIDAARSGRAIVFTSGDGNEKTVQLPTDALTDINGKDITSYIARVDVSGQKLRITDGAGNAYTFTVPFANAAGKAETDINDKAITSYVADLVVSGNNLVVKDGNGNTLRTLTVSYADESGTANKARKDLNNNEFLSDYAELIVVDSDGKRVGLEAHDGTRLSTITVPFATLATDATNAIESVLVNGNQLQFRTYGGTVTNITVPYALKAVSDGSNNEIVSNYVADVVNDAQTGKITFLAKDGSTIAELIPTVDSAVHDSYGNTIADFVKTIAVSAGSDYVTVTHGTGTTETLLIDYSNRAWKDTNGNIIKNVYVADLDNEKDGNNQYVIIAKNGEGSEIFRFVVKAYSAQVDDLGNEFSSTYINDLSYDGVNNKLVAKSPDGSTVDDPQLPAFATLPTYVYKNAYFVGENGKIKHRWRALNLYDTNDNLIETWGNEEVNTVKDLSFLNVVKVDNPSKDIVTGCIEPKEYLADTWDGEIGIYKPVINSASLVYGFSVNSKSPAQGCVFYMDRGNNPSGYNNPGNTRAIPQTYEKTILKPWATYSQTINANSGGTLFFYFDNYNGIIDEIIDMNFVSIPELKINSWSFSTSGDNLEFYIDVTNTTASSITVNTGTVEVEVEINPYKMGKFDWGDDPERIGQIQKTWDIYVDFDDEVDNTIKASYADWVTLISWSIPGDTDYPGPKVKLGNGNTKYINAIRVIKRENSPDRTILNYQLENGTSFTVMNSDNTLEVAKINFVEGYGSFTYESANDDINYLEDGDIIEFYFGDYTDSGWGFYITAIVKK